MELYGEEDMGDFSSSDIDWGEESSQSLGEEGPHEGEPWGNITDSEISFGEESAEEEPEPEPPDPSNAQDAESYTNATYASTTWSQPNSYLYEHEEESEEDLYEYHNPPEQEEKSNNGGSTTYRVQAHSKPTSPKKQVNKRSGYISNSLVFSGYSKNPEDYLQWERNMKQWLRSNNIPKEEKLSYAVQALAGDAYKWWLKDCTPGFYNKQVLDWGDLKARMYREFVKKHQTRSNITTKPMYHDTSRRVMYSPHLQPVRNQKLIYGSAPKEVFTKASPSQSEAKKIAQVKKDQQKPASTFLLDTPELQEQWRWIKEFLQLKEEKTEQKQSHKVAPKATTSSSNTLPKKSQDTPTQGKSSNFVNPKEPTCYRCHKRGHFASNCPSRNVLKDHSLPELKSEVPKVSDSLSLSDLLISNSRLIHLSLPKESVSGLSHTPTEDRSSISLEKQHSERTTSLACQGMKNGHSALKSRKLKLPCSTPANLNDKTTSVKAECTLHGILVSNNYDLMQYWNNILVRHSFTYSVFNDPTSSIKHLIFFLSVKKKTGARGVCNGWRAHNDQPVVITNIVLPQEELNGGNKCEKGVFTKAATLPLKEVRIKPWRGVIASSLIKEEPPDAHTSSHIKRQKYFGQGKFLDSYTCKDTNLLYLGAGYIVSRSKPFQEGEYDEDIISSSTKEHGTRSLEEEIKKLRRAKEASELSSAQVEAKIKYSSSTNKWRSYSIHPELVTKKNQPERIPNKEDIEDTVWKIFNGPDGDMRPLIEPFRPNQDEPSCKSNCFGFSTHHRKTEIWFHNQINFGSRVIDFTNQVNRSFPDFDIGVLIGGFRSNQKEISYKSICYGILTQPGSSSNWNHINTGFGVEVIQLLNRMILSLPYLETHGFNKLQTRLWRPGERSKHSGDSSRHLGGPDNIFPCTSAQRIRRILTHFYLPYMEAFTLGSITHQRLSHQSHDILELFSGYFDVLSCTKTHQINQINQELHLPFLDPFAIKIQRLHSHQDYCVLGFIYDDQNVPKKLTYTLKPSRYKANITALESSHLTTQIFQRLYSLLSRFL